MTERESLRTFADACCGDPACPNRCEGSVAAEEYAWCWIACPHDPPCSDAPLGYDRLRDE